MILSVIIKILADTSIHCFISTTQGVLGYYIRQTMML